MLRSRLLVCVPLLVLLLAPLARAGDKPALASDDEAKAAIARFRETYKAKGLKGDDRLMERDFALRTLAKVQHPLVADEIGKIARKSDLDLATLGVIYLAEQRAVPGRAGPHVLSAMKKHKKDAILLMSALDTLAYLRYYGARKQIADLMKHRDWSVRKYAIRAAGWMQDVRLMPTVLKILGIDAKNEKQQQGKQPDTDKGGKGEPEQTSEGYSWDGVEVNYDTGTPGDHDQKMAEKIGREKMAQNKAKAEAGARRGGGGGGTAGGPGGGSAAGPRGAQGRSLEELVPTILRALKSMTGEEFANPGQIRKWLRANREQLKEMQRALDRREKQQRAA